MKTSMHQVRLFIRNPEYKKISDIQNRLEIVEVFNLGIYD